MQSDCCKLINIIVDVICLKMREWHTQRDRHSEKEKKKETETAKQKERKKR